MREEIRILSEAVDRNERLAFVGASGCGKTSTIRELLLSRRDVPQRIIAFDPYRDLGLPEVRTRAEGLRILEGPWGRVASSREELWAELVRVAMKAGGALIVADEAQRLLPSSGRRTEASGVLLTVATEGRHEKCPLLWATQSPGRCSYSLTDNSTGARVVGSLSGPASLSRVVDWGFERAEVAALGYYELLLRAPGVQGVRRFRSRKM